MSEAPAVEATSLRKRFEDLEAVAGIDFSIRAGECFGFLGPNGAGKTSTMRMLAAVSVPSGGRLSVLGLDPVTHGKQVRSRLGVCPQADNLDPDLHVRQNLLVYGAYFGQPAALTAQRADELLQLMALSERKDARISELSGGMKRRLIVARALINTPELLLLDEPTTGLDPQARHMLWQKLRELRKSGTTMVLTTHYMDEAERLCDRLVIMDHGKILDQGTPRELVERHVGREVVELVVAVEAEAPLLDGLDASAVASERAGDRRLFFFADKSALGDALVERARQTGVTCLVRNATLEDVFLKLAGRELSE